MNLFDLLVAVDLDKFFLYVVVVEQLDGFVEEDVQAFLHRLAFVVLALVQFAAVDIAFARDDRGLGVDVVDVLVSAANIATA